MDAAAIRFVRERAGESCEYCGLPQEFSGLRFHIEHIVARQHGGSDEINNLALACPECNLRKGTNLTGIDPQTGQVTPVFNPRQDRWPSHFVYIEASIAGKTPCGRTTVLLLQMNQPDRLRLRQHLMRLGLLND